MRAPRLGKVKTRLASGLDDAHVFELYKCFVTDTLTAVKALGYPIRLFYQPAGAKKALEKWLGGDFDYLPQNGDDLGRRMADAFEQTFSDGFDRAVLVGTDLPDLPAEIVSEAIRHLDTHEAVIGPSDDGGYYLIGFSAQTYFKSVFSSMNWGAADVYDRTIKHLGRELESVHVLPRWYDIDTISDLKAFCHRRHMGGAKATRRYIEKMDLKNRLAANR